MKTYIMSIAGAVLISMFADMILPDKWNKYIKIITGLIIIGTITLPVADIDFPDMDMYIEQSEYFEDEGEGYRRRLIKEQLSSDIAKDIETRIFDEFSLNVSADVEIATNENNEITGVKKIRIKGVSTGDEVRKRLDEIYSPQEVIIDGH